MLALRLLGPPVLESPDVSALAWPTAKGAALLAVLAIDGPTPRERLAAWLWPQQDATASRRNLRRELARLREAGAGGAWVAEGARLMLDATVAVDCAQFDRLLDAGDADAALALWRGPLADGLSLPDAPAFEEWLAGARARWARRRVAALEGMAAAREAAGDADGALRTIERLLDEDPLQEAHQRSAMRLHAAAGRRAAAIAGYERFAALLSSELGLAPMADTLALARALRHADAPAVTPAPPAPQPPAQAASTPWAGPRLLPFVGRESELAALDAAWREGCAIVIEGPAGVGKTRLATEFAAARGAFALAACRPGDAAQPYAAFKRALRLLAGQALTADDWPRWVSDELAHLLPEFGPAPQRIDSDSARQRFFRACAAAWSLLATGSFDIVIVDDWHLADAQSRLLLDFIVRERSARRLAAAAPGAVAEAGEGPCEVLLLRPDLLPTDRAPIDALAREGLALRLMLAPLSPSAVDRLAEQLSGLPPPPQLSDRLVRASGGNPFALGETLRHWAALSLWQADAQGRWSLDDDAAAAAASAGGDAVPQAARQTVLARAAALPEPARRVLEAASLAAEPFTPALLAGACALSEVQALDAIDAAMAAHLLRERDGGFAFTHDLVQAALESTLGDDRKRLVHRRLALGAQALHGLVAVPAAEIARHWELGGEPQRAVEPRLAAAEAAYALFSEETAELHWARALADGATLAQQVHVAARRGSMARNRDDRDGMQAAVDELDRLRALCAQHPDTAEAGLDAAIEAADLRSLMSACAEALSGIDAVLAALPAHSGGPELRRARALLVRSQALNGCGRPGEGAAAGEAALALGNLPLALQGRLLHSIVYAHFLDSRIGDALAGAERTLLLWRSTGNRRSIARAHANIGLMNSLLGRQDVARRELGQAIALAREMRMAELVREALLNLAYIDLHDGRPQAALDALGAAWDASPTFTSATSPVFIRGMQVHGHAHQGQLARALEMAEDGHRRAVAIGSVHGLTDCVSMVLDLATDIGDFALAAAWVASLPPRDEMERLYRTKLVFNLVRLALARGDLELAAAELATLDDLAAMPQPYDRGYAALRHAELSLARGDGDGALAWLARGQPDATHIEARALMLAARLRALALLGGSARSNAADAARHEAAALLGGTATVPAFAALALRRACGEDIRESVLALAATLGERPGQRECLLARWSGTGLQR
jgi:DNA-binding SARP family transcriptional activator